MNWQLAWNNLVVYSLQIGLLVGVAAVVPAVLRLRVPRARLAYWHILLAACLLLPQVRPWRRQIVASDIAVATRILETGPATPAPRSIPWNEIALALVAAGAVARLAWLGVGLWKLRLLKRRGVAAPAGIAAAWGGQAALLLSEEVASPVTFGWRRPVVLLPARFPEFNASVQQAVLCHELVHVARRDWLFALAEELVRAVFWFHPAIWWLLGEIQLAREESVDREAIRRTESRDDYVDALLAIAGADVHCDLAPAPLFLRKRHLKHRVVSIFKEVGMSKTRLYSALAGCLATLAAACWMVTAALPLAASPQVASDAQGVTVDTGGATLLHRPPVPYPADARRKGVSGTVSLQLAIDAEGNVTDAHALSGPPELRRAAIQSALDWHFAHDSAGATRQVAISFQSSEAAPAAAGAAAPKTGGAAISYGDKAWHATLKSLAIVGLPESASADLRARLPVHEGDVLNNDSLAELQIAVGQFDQHLTFGIAKDGEDAFNVQIAPPGFHIRVGGNVQQTMLVQQPRPAYPPEAKAARIQGVVHLKALIAMDGTVKSLEVLDGDPTLAAAALTAVKQWVYRPTLLNGDPVEVQTAIDVNFTLSK